MMTWLILARLDEIANVCKRWSNMMLHWILKGTSRDLLIPY